LRVGIIRVGKRITKAKRQNDEKRFKLKMYELKSYTAIKFYDINEFDALYQFFGK